MIADTVYSRNSQYIKYLEELGLLEEEDGERIYDLPKEPGFQGEALTEVPNKNARGTFLSLVERLAWRWKAPLAIYWRLAWFMRAIGDFGVNFARTEYARGRRISVGLNLATAVTAITALQFSSNCLLLGVAALATVLITLFCEFYFSAFWEMEQAVKAAGRGPYESIQQATRKIVRFLRNWESLTNGLGLNYDRREAADGREGDGREGDGREGGNREGDNREREDINYRSIFQNKTLTCERLRGACLHSLNKAVERLVLILPYLLGEDFLSRPDPKLELYRTYIEREKSRREPILVNDIVKALDVFADIREHSFDLLRLLTVKAGGRPKTIALAVKKLGEFSKLEEFSGEHLRRELRYAKDKIISSIEVSPLQKPPGGGVLFHQSCNLKREATRLRDLLLYLSTLLKKERKEIDLGFLLSESENLVTLISETFDLFSQSLRSELADESSRRRSQKRHRVEKTAGPSSETLEREAALSDSQEQAEQSHLKIFEMEPLEEDELDYQKPLFPESRRYAKIKAPLLNPESEYMMKELKSILSKKNERTTAETIKVQQAESGKRRNLKELAQGIAQEKKAFISDSTSSLLSELSQLNKPGLGALISEADVIGD